MNDRELATRERILVAARREFFQKGFHRASLRDIADAANVTTGSLYWHFKNKVELLDTVIGPHYEHVVEIYKRFVESYSRLSISEKIANIHSDSLACVFEILDYMYAYIPEFKFLVANASDTKYANFLHELIEYEMDETHKFYELLEEQYATLQDDFREIEHMIVSGLFTSIFEMFIHEYPLDKAKRCAVQIVNFYTAGWLYVMDFPLPEAMKKNKKNYSC